MGSMQNNSELLLESVGFRMYYSFLAGAGTGEAMDIVIDKTQLVTVPILDSRLGVIDSRFSDIDRRFAQIEVRFERMEARFAKIDARFESMEARFNVVNAGIDGEEASLETGYEAMIDIIFRKWGFRIILATVLSQAALGPVGLSALELAKRLLSTVGH